MSDFRIQNSVNDEIDEAAIECVKKLAEALETYQNKIGV